MPLHRGGPGRRILRFEKRERRSESSHLSPDPHSTLGASPLGPLDLLRPEPLPLRPGWRQGLHEAPCLVGVARLPLAPQGLARGEPAAFERPPSLAHLPDGSHLRAIRGTRDGRRQFDARTHVRRGTTPGREIAGFAGTPRVIRGRLAGYRVSRRAGDSLVAFASLGSTPGQCAARGTG